MTDFHKKSYPGSPSLPVPVHANAVANRPSYLRRFIWVIATVCSLRLLFIHSFRFFGDIATVRRNPAYLIRASHGAVATENVRCSNIGVDVLKEGGNAIDAAIASTLCIGVVNMFS
jgi:gamma-glutamyltranspeptidase / glutathione hydrolase / leukotriene-C4 hydrolase